MQRLPALLFLTLLASGCYSWTTIKPTELPKLNGASSTTTHAWGGQVTLVTATKVETPDGRLVEIEGESDARVKLRGQAELVFDHPLMSSVDGDALTIQSGNLSKRTIPLDKIEHVEVSQFERTQAAVAGTLLGLAASTLIVLALR